MRVRSAAPSDLAFVRSLGERLVAFGPPRWRDPEAIAVTSERLLADALERSGDVVALLLAEGSDGTPLGLVHVEEARDFFSHERQGYVAHLAVTVAAEGRGVGRALMDAAEAWCRERGLRWLTLYVFAANAQARAFYARLGFEEDSLKLVREIAD